MNEDTKQHILKCKTNGTVNMTGVPGRERGNLGWALNMCELRMGRKKGGPSGDMNGCRGEQAEMYLLSSATRNTSLTQREGLLGAAQGENRKVC